MPFFCGGERDLYYSRAKKVLPTQARDIVRAGAEPDHSTVLRPSKVRQRMAYIILLSRNMNNMSLPFTHKTLHFRNHHGVLRAVLAWGIDQLHYLQTIALDDECQLGPLEG